MEGEVYNCIYEGLLREKRGVEPMKRVALDKINQKLQFIKFGVDSRWYHRVP